MIKKIIPFILLGTVIIGSLALIIVNGISIHKEFTDEKLSLIIVFVVALIAGIYEFPKFLARNGYIKQK